MVRVVTDDCPVPGSTTLSRTTYCTAVSKTCAAEGQVTPALLSKDAQRTRVRVGEVPRVGEVVPGVVYPRAAAARAGAAVEEHRERRDTRGARHREARRRV